MELEKQVTSLALSKKLKKLGVKQDSLWYWHRVMMGREDFDNYEIRLSDKIDEMGDGWKGMHQEYFSAFTPAELGEKLPSRANNKNVVFSKIGRKYEIFLHRKDEEIVQKEYFRAKTEANARAKMLIYLKENKIIP